MTTLTAAKAWFTNNPQSRVIYHCRMQHLSPASRERLALPRTTTVRGSRVCFSDGSELSLRGDGTSRATEGGLLDILGPDGRIIVTYAAIQSPARTVAPGITKTFLP